MADKILIVDDDPAICKLLEKVMHSNELETTTVNCGMDALSILKNHTSDLILMDSCETYKNLSTANIPGFEVIFDNSFITLANTVFKILMVIL